MEFNVRSPPGVFLVGSCTRRHHHRTCYFIPNQLQQTSVELNPAESPGLRIPSGIPPPIYQPSFGRTLGTTEGGGLGDHWQIQRLWKNKGRGCLARMSLNQGGNGKNGNALHRLKTHLFPHLVGRRLEQLHKHRHCAGLDDHVGVFEPRSPNIKRNHQGKTRIGRC